MSPIKVRNEEGIAVNVVEDVNEGEASNNNIPTCIETPEVKVGGEQDVTSELDAKEAEEEQEKDEEPESTIRFTTIEIREFERCMGDNPSVIWGPPLSNAWEHHNELKFELDEYESNRPERRHGLELLIPADLREQQLRDLGYSLDEIRIGMRDVNFARARRRRTTELLHLTLFQETIEKTYRGLRNFFAKKRKQEERAFLKACMELDSKKARDQANMDDDCSATVSVDNSGKSITRKSRQGPESGGVSIEFDAKGSYVGFEV